MYNYGWLVLWEGGEQISVNIILERNSSKPPGKWKLQPDPSRPLPGRGGVQVRAPTSWPESTPAVDSCRAQWPMWHRADCPFHCGWGLPGLVFLKENPQACPFSCQMYPIFMCANHAFLIREWQSLRRGLNHAGSRGYRDALLREGRCSDLLSSLGPAESAHSQLHTAAHLKDNFVPCAFFHAELYLNDNKTRRLFSEINFRWDACKRNLKRMSGECMRNKTQSF